MRTRYTLESSEVIETLGENKMQIETTTIQTNHTMAQNINFKVTTFEQITTAFCDCCQLDRLSVFVNLFTQSFSIYPSRILYASNLRGNYRPQFRSINPVIKQVTNH